MIYLNVDIPEEDPTLIIQGDEDSDLEDFENDDPFSEVDPSDER